MGSIINWPRQLFPVKRTSPWRTLCAVVVFCASAAAQATYTYTGNPFTLFSCGGNTDGVSWSLCSTPGPNANTSYSATDHVTATLTLDSALPSNMAITDVRILPGFQLVMSDGEHTVTNAQQVGMFAEVATDGNGNISLWHLVINTGYPDNGGVSTTSNGTFTSDSGTLLGVWPGNDAIIFSSPGMWTSGTSVTPAQAVTNLINLLSNPMLELTAGQINSLTDKLNNVLASINTGQTKQAINQLNAFIGSVQSAVKNAKMSAQTGTTLINAANAIIAHLQGQ